MDRESNLFSERLRTAREGAGLTQTAAARAVNATPSQWSNWERAVSKPYADDLCAIAELLGVSLHWLLLGDGPMDAASLRVAATASAHNVSAAAILEAVRAMSADELIRMGEAKRAEESKAWNQPLDEAIAALEQALGNNPPLAVRDEINRTIERMRQRLSGEGSAPGGPQRMIYRAPPVDKGTHTEEVEVQYEARAEPPPKPGRGAKGAGA